MFEYYIAALLGLRRRGDLAPIPPPPNLSLPLAPPDAPVPAGSLTRCRELFPELDRELDAWDAEYGWLYR